MKKALKCSSPLPVPKHKQNLMGKHIRCGRCHPCQTHRRMEWANRMKLETFQKPLPLFITWTFKPENYQDSVKFAKTEIQKLKKRIRKDKHDLRYFTVIERGSLRKRVHAHSIIWSKSLQSLTEPEINKYLHFKWNNGIIDIQQAQTSGSMGYVTKYIMKDIDYDSGEKHVRNYQFSRNLGIEGVKFWEQTIFHYHKQIPYTEQNLPKNYVIIPLGGEAQKVFIPLNYQLALLKKLGIQLHKPIEETKLIDLVNGTQKKHSKIFIPNSVLQRI